MIRNETLSVLAIALCLLCGSCGTKKDYGADISMGVNGDGLIIATNASSCVDKQDPTSGARSVAKNALIFSNFSLQYTGVGKTLFIGSMDVTVTSSGIKGGSTTIPITGDEIEALLAAPGQLITIPSGTNSYTINSNSSSRPASYPACQLAVGPITVADPSVTTFTANVEISIVGSATNNTTGDVERVEKKITAHAKY